MSRSLSPRRKVAETPLHGRTRTPAIVRLGFPQRRRGGEGRRRGRAFGFQRKGAKDAKDAKERGERKSGGVVVSVFGDACIRLLSTNARTRSHALCR